MNKQPIRILHVFTILNRGGAESMIMNYYRRIDRSIIQFDFLVHREEKGAFEDEIESLGGKIYRMPRINPLFPMSYYKTLNYFFKEHTNYKIIHSHINTLSSFPLKIAKKHHLQCRIAHAHTSIPKMKVNFSFVFLKEIGKLSIKNILKRKIKQYATDIIACSESAGDWMFGKNSNYSILNNAVDTSMFQYSYIRSVKIRSELGLREDELAFCHIGNFSYAKNYPFLLEVFNKISQKANNAKFILIGGGFLRKKVEEKAKQLNLFEKIFFLGIRFDIPDILQANNVMIFPSVYEGLPVTLIEAQASGLKVFASDTITDEVALTDDISFLSLEKSAEYWADRILEAIPYDRKDNSELIKAKGYDVAENAKKLQDFYLEQINKINNER